MKNARETALKILYSVEYEGAYINMAIKGTFAKNKDLSPHDRAFITRIVYGVIKRKLTLEYIIEQYSKIKPKKISKFIFIILQMGIYQLKFMDRVPESAAVNECVKLSKRYGHGASAGFVNGILRTVAKSEINYPKDKMQRLSYIHSYPMWLCEKWCDDYGYEFSEKLMIAMNKEANVTLRANTLKTNSEEIAQKNEGIEISPLYKNALISKGFDIASSKIFNDGLVIAQDISAMIASLALNPKKGSRVLDMCAAPGGKTTHLAELMENEGEIIACDIYEHKINLIAENAKRMGINIINPRICDASQYIKDFNLGFDYVLADVPCSGLGVIKRKPEIKWKTQDFAYFAEIAQKILTNAAKYVKIGGEVVFSTCTLNRTENEERFFEFLKNNDNFIPVDITEFIPKALNTDTSGKGYVTFYPHIHNIDGFFIAKAKRCK